LSQKYQLRNGIKGVVRGTLPVGGLSSSAAVVLCYLNALCLANDITLSPSELIKTALFAENGYVGINVGKLDQSCEVLELSVPRTNSTISTGIAERGLQGLIS